MRLFRCLSFSWKRATGISGMKTGIARKTGVPTTSGGFANSPKVTPEDEMKILSPKD